MTPEFHSLIKKIINRHEFDDEISSHIIQVIKSSTFSSVILSFISTTKGQKIEVRGKICQSGKNPDDVWIRGAYFNSISKYLAIMCEDAELRTIVIGENPLTHVSNHVFDAFRRTNICRDKGGKLFAKYKLKKILSSHQNFKNFVASALIHGDAEAYAFAKTFNPKYSADKQMLSIVESLSVTIHPSISFNHEHDSVGSYFRRIMASSKESLATLLKTDYRKDIIVKHGNLILEELLKDTSHSVNHLEEFLKIAIQDGLDWYAAYANHYGSKLDRFDLEQRQRDPLKEFEFFYSRAKNTVLIARIIIKALPESLKVEYAKQHISKAISLYEFTNDKCFLPYTGKKYKARLLESDLDL